MSTGNFLRLERPAIAAAHAVSRRSCKVGATRQLVGQLRRHRKFLVRSPFISLPLIHLVQYHYAYAVSRCFVPFVCRVVLFFAPTGQLEPLHGAGIRARRGDVLPPQEDRQVQVRKTATDGLSPRSRAGGCIDRRVEGAQTALVMHA